MNPLTHAVISWDVASVSSLGRRDLALVTLAGIAPDIDGAGLLIDAWHGIATDGHAQLFAQYHHQVGHNLWAGLALAVLATVPARRRLATFIMALLTFHLHLVCDLIGSRGPDGHQWPIPYLGALAPTWQLTWSGQWELNAWPNLAITAVGLAFLLGLACRRGFSPLWYLSARADAALVATLRARFTPARSPETPSRSA